MGNSVDVTVRKPFSYIKPLLRFIYITTLRNFTNLTLSIPPDSSCTICKGSEKLEYCSGCKIRYNRQYKISTLIRAYCCNQHKAQDYWNHVPECKDVAEFDTQRILTQNQLTSLLKPEANLSKEQMREKIHLLHICIEDILQQDRKRTPALQRLGNALLQSILTSTKATQNST
jgi:hypothetical protein